METCLRGDDEVTTVTSNHRVATVKTTPSKKIGACWGSMVTAPKKNNSVLNKRRIR